MSWNSMIIIFLIILLIADIIIIGAIFRSRSSLRLEMISMITALMTLAVSFFTEYQEDSLLQKIDITLVIEISLLIALLIIIAVTIKRAVNRIKPKKKIFISYSQADTEDADTIIHIIQQNLLNADYSYSIVSDKKIEVGENISNFIINEILTSYAVIVLISEKYITSGFCLKELEFILSQQTQVIPIIMGSFDIIDAFPGYIKHFLRTTKCVVLTNEDISDKSRLERLLQPLSDSLKKVDASSPKSTTAFSPDGKTVAICKKDGTIQIWDILKNTLRMVLKASSHEALEAKFSPDGHFLSTTYSDGTIMVWELDTGRVINTFKK